MFARFINIQQLALQQLANSFSYITEPKHLRFCVCHSCVKYLQ